MSATAKILSKLRYVTGEMDNWSNNFNLAFWEIEETKEEPIQQQQLQQQLQPPVETQLE